MKSMTRREPPAARCAQADRWTARWHDTFSARASASIQLSWRDRLLARWRGKATRGRRTRCSGSRSRNLSQSSKTFCAVAGIRRSKRLFPRNLVGALRYWIYPMVLWRWLGVKNGMIRIFVCSVTSNFPSVSSGRYTQSSSHVLPMRDPSLQSKADFMFVLPKKEENGWLFFSFFFSFFFFFFFSFFCAACSPLSAAGRFVAGAPPTACCRGSPRSRSLSKRPDGWAGSPKTSARTGCNGHTRQQHNVALSPFGQSVWLAGPFLNGELSFAPLQQEHRGNLPLLAEDAQ